MAAAAAESKVIRVLLVEDEEIHKVLARALLRSVGGGAELDEAGTSAEAVRRVRDRGAGAYDLIITDGKMPVMDGHEDLDNPEHIQPTQQGSSQQQSQQSNEGLRNVSSPSQGMLFSTLEQVQQGQMQQRRPPDTTWNQDMYSSIAGRATQTAQQQQQLLQQGRPPDYKITIPALLPGRRCLTDASIATDDQTTAPHGAAGLGVLIINTQTNQTQVITIQGSIDNVSSVIMAEAEAMALAARVARALGLQKANYLCGLGPWA